MHRQLANTGGKMILGDTDPVKGFLAASLATIGLLSMMFRWLREKDRDQIQANKNQNAGNSGEIEKLWAVIKEDKATIKDLNIELREVRQESSATQNDLRESKADRERLHSENRDLVKRVDVYHNEAIQLRADKERLAKQNDLQASQILKLQQERGSRISPGNGEQ